MNASNASILLPALLAASCASYRDLRTPPSAGIETVVRLDSTSGAPPPDTTFPGDAPWREYFSDPGLRALIAEGLDSSADLQVALARIEATEAALSSSRVGQGPAVSAMGAASYTRRSNGSDGVLGTASDAASLGLTASWELDLWGRLSSVSKARYAAVLESREYADLVRTQVVADVATGYYTLLALDEQIQATEESVDLLERSAETMSALREAGTQTDAAVAQTRAAAQGARISLTVLKRQVLAQENALSVLLGRAPGPITRSTLETQTPPVGIGKGVPIQALARRPDVRQAELAVQEAWATTDAARSALWPTLTLTGGSSSGTFFGLVGGFSGFFSLDNLVANLAGSLVQPLTGRGALKAAVRTAEASQREALVEFRRTVLVAGQEVSDVLAGYAAASERDSLREEQIASLERTVEATDLLLGAGEANSVEVISAQEGLLAARLARISDRLERLTLAVDLYRSLGGGTR